MLKVGLIGCGHISETYFRSQNYFNNINIVACADINVDAAKKCAQEYNIDLKNVAYVGNDINDKDAMDISGIKFCPADAHDSIKSISNYVLKTKGGQGVIRELLDIITNNKNNYEQSISLY